jgi:hypothetical protein
MVGMNLKLKTGQKLLFVFSFLFLYLFLPFNNVTAMGDSIIFGETAGAVNETTYGCDQVTGNGLIIQTVEGIERITTVPFAVANCEKIKAENGGTTPTGYFYGPKSNNSLLNVTVGATQALIDQKPASGVDFIQNKVYALTNFGTVSAQDPQTYYPGAGADLLRPIQAFWGWSVNFVFSFLILLILAIAFAIIFRQRLGGAANVTIQNSIPNIAMALILVPLSYAISGLFIDAVTLGTNAVHGFLLGPGAPGRDVYDTRNDPTGDGDNCEPYDPSDVATENCDRGLYADDERVNIWNVRGKVSVSDEIGNVIGATVEGANTNDTAVSIVVGIFNVIVGVVNIIAGGNVNQYAWIGTIINFFISLLTIWISIKIAWHLFQKFLTFLLMPIFAPFVFATVAFPGNGLKSVVNYSKQMGSASLAYIVTYLMFILTIVFTSEGFQSQFPDIRTGGYVPPLLGLNSVLNDVQGTGVTSLVLSLVGIGIFFSIPNVLKSIDKSLGVEFAIPTFVKDPFVNMKESFNMTFRTAPSLAYRGGGAALGATGNARMLPGRIGRDFKNRAGNIRAGINKAADNITGVAGTDASRMATMEDNMSKQLTTLEGEKARLQKVMNDQLKAGEVGAARNTARQIKTKDAEIADLKSTAESRGIKGLTAEGRKGSSFDIKFIDKNDNEGSYLINFAEWKSILAELAESERNPNDVRRYEIGKLKFTLGGGKFEGKGIIANYRLLIRAEESQTDYIVDRSVSTDKGEDIEFNTLSTGPRVLVPDMVMKLGGAPQPARLSFKQEANTGSTSDSISFKLVIEYNHPSQFLRAILGDKVAAPNGLPFDPNSYAGAYPIEGNGLLPAVNMGRPRRLEFTLKAPVVTEPKAVMIPVKIDVHRR